MTRRPERLGQRHGPKRMADLLAQLMARRGYAREHAASACAEAWAQAVGARMIGHSQPGRVRSGVLEITVRNSVALQELTFQKKQLIRDLARLLPAEQIHDIRFRVGAID